MLSLSFWKLLSSYTLPLWFSPGDMRITFVDLSLLYKKHFHKNLHINNTTATNVFTGSIIFFLHPPDERCIEASLYKKYRFFKQRRKDSKYMNYLLSHSSYCKTLHLVYFCVFLTKYFDFRIIFHSI